MDKYLAIYLNDTQPKTSIRFHRAWFAHRPGKIYEKCMFKIIGWSAGLYFAENALREIAKYVTK